MYVEEQFIYWGEVLSAYEIQCGCYMVGVLLFGGGRANNWEVILGDDAA